MSATEKKAKQSAALEISRILKLVPGAIKIDGGKKGQRAVSRGNGNNAILSKSGSMHSFKKHQKLLQQTG